MKKEETATQQLTITPAAKTALASVKAAQEAKIKALLGTTYKLTWSEVILALGKMYEDLRETKP